MRKMKSFQSAAGAATVVAVSLLLGCSSMSVSEPDARAELGPASGSQVAGAVTFTRLSGGGVHVDGDLSGLTFLARQRRGGFGPCDGHDQ